MKLNSLLLLVLLAGCAGPISSPPPAPSTPAHEPLSNTLRWTTASEVDNFGFDIYRSTSADGPFDRVTEEPLAGSGTTDVPSSYEFIDDTIEADQEYFYYIESISMSGVREDFTPVSRVGPKVKKSD